MKRRGPRRTSLELRAEELGLASIGEPRLFLGRLTNASLRAALDAVGIPAFLAYTREVQALAEQSAAKSLELVQIQYRNGSASYLQELDATRQYQQTRIGLIQARAARFADTAALYTALGGGWKEGTDTDKPVAAATPREN